MGLSHNLIWHQTHLSVHLPPPPNQAVHQPVYEHQGKHQDGTKYDIAVSMPPCFLFFFPDQREGGNFKAAVKRENKAAESVCQGGQPWQSQQGTSLRIRKHSSFFKQVAAFHTQSTNIISPRTQDTSSKSFLEAQCPAAAPGTPRQQGAARDGSLAWTSEAVSSYRRPC